MLNKKAIELSLNFIIIIIMSIVVFGFGIKFIYELASKANTLHDLTLDDLDKRIGSLVCDGSERACIGIDKKTIKRNKYGVFGLGIINLLDKQDFVIEVSPTSPAGYKKNNEPLSSSLTIVPTLSIITIDRNAEKNIGIGIEAPASAESGTYIFNVNIYISNPPPALGRQKYVATQKIYVEVP